MSAGEHFALAMKRTHRAVLIGQPTRGANHFGGDLQLTEHFAAFIPVGRTFDPDTGRDWEGNGVAPDITCPEDTALDRALALEHRAGNVRQRAGHRRNRH
jgi:C-terminal processing protease CtpA/Prc